MRGELLGAPRPVPRLTPGHPPPPAHTLTVKWAPTAQWARGDPVPGDRAGVRSAGGRQVRFAGCISCWKWHLFSMEEVADISGRCPLSGRQAGVKGQ